MEKLSPDLQKISNFIYQKPEVVAMLLNEHGYTINIDKATLQQINQYTFEALYSGDMAFAQSFDEAIENDGYLGIAVTIGLAVASSVVSGIMGSNEAARAREYRKLLQTESTARLKDTWIYIVGLGLGMGLFYGIYLISKK